MDETLDIILTATKANQLFWLGRYVERVYLSLHLMRRYYDLMIDGKTASFEDYYQRLSVPNDMGNNEVVRTSQMYDANNPSSILSELKAAYDNAIVLREDIKTESLAYIEMSLCHIKKCAENNVSNITELQPITDYLLAFFGSIYERVFNVHVRNLINIGKLVENIDMHLRFDYPFYRIEEAFSWLKEFSQRENNLFDHTKLQEINSLIKADIYNPADVSYKNMLLLKLNKLVLI